MFCLSFIISLSLSTLYSSIFFISKPIDVDGTNHAHHNNIHINNEITTETNDNKDNNDNTVDEYLSKDLPIGVEISMDAIAQRVAKGSPIDYRQVYFK